MNKKILISIPSLWAIRNFIYSGLIEDLKSKYSIVIMLPEGSEYLSLVINTGCEYIEYPICKYNFLERVLSRSLNSKLLKRSEAMRKSKLVSLSMETPNSTKGRILKLLTTILSNTFSEDILFFIYGKVTKDHRFDRILEYINKNKEALIIATNIVVKHELMLFMHLKNNPINKIDFINSFDNTTSRGFVPFRLFDHHLVWNKKMKDELIQIFNVDTDKVSIIGTPQFDLLIVGGNSPLLKNDLLYSVVENKKYILYCAGHFSLFPFEVNIVQNMVIELNNRNNDLIFIIRMHPLDNHQRWQENQFPQNVIFDTPWKQNETNPLMSVPEKYEYLRHGRILNKAQLILNIGSTTSLDACVLNKPVFNLNFNEDNTNGELDIIYKSEHYEPIIASEAAPLVYSIDELEHQINAIYNNQESTDQSLKRQKFAEEYCGFSNSNLFSDRFEDYLQDAFVA